MPTLIQKLADLHDAERHTVGLKGVRASNGVTRSALVKILRAYQREESLHLAIGESLAPMVPIIRDAMVVAHLRGYVRSFLTAAPHLLREPSRVGLSVYSSTIDFLQRRAAMTDEQVAMLRTQYGQQAFGSVAGMGRGIEQRIQGALLEIRQRQMLKPDAMSLLRHRLQETGLRPGASLIETTFRTQGQIAYSVGRQDANAAPEIDEILWGYEYATVGDDRVRPNHEALDGIRLPKDDPRWNEIMPPNGYNCRCTVVEIFKDQENLATIDAPPPEGAPDDGWDFNPANVFSRAA